MGTFDQIVANYFGTDAQGRRIYAPKGRRGKAFVVPDDRAEQIASSLKRAFQVLIFGIALAAGLLWGSLLLLAVAILLLNFIISGIRRVKGLEEVQGEWSLGPKRERSSRGAQAIGKNGLRGFLLISAIALIVSVSELMLDATSVSAWTVLILSAAGVAVFTAQLKLLKQPGGRVAGEPVAASEQPHL